MEAWRKMENSMRAFKYHHFPSMEGTLITNQYNFMTNLFMEISKYAVIIRHNIEIITVTATTIQFEW